MSGRRLPFILFALVSPVVLGSFLLGIQLAPAIYAREPGTWWSESIEERVRQLVEREYVDEIDEERGQELFFAAMKGYLGGLDDYSTFYDPEERRRMEEDTSGQFGGVGILVRMVEGEMVIVGLRKGDPAERAGVRLGDRIALVDETKTEGKELEDLTPLIRGAPGTKVTLRVLRGERSLSLELVRTDIKQDSVTGVRIVDEEHGVGYLRVRSFQENTGEDAKAALLWLLGKGARAFVLDLRHNSGGVLEKGAVSLVDLFLDDGPIVQTRGRTADSRRVYQAKPETTVCRDEPVIVLVDSGSASAAEVVAGAFQDRRRGILLGERTYGKFLVQSIHRLPDLPVALQLTTAKYYTPYGRWLQRSNRAGIRGGLLPDVVVPRTGEETERLLKEEWPRQHGMDMVVMDEGGPVSDPQLDRAVSLLSDYEAVTGGK